MSDWAMRYTIHTGYERPDFRPQFLGTVGTADPAAHVRYAAGMGMAGVLYPWALDRPQDEVARVKTALEETGLVNSCILSSSPSTLSTPLWIDRSASGRARLEEISRQACELAVSLRSHVLAAFPTTIPGHGDTEQQCDHAIANLVDIAALAAEFGLSLGLEPMTAIPILMFQTISTALDAVRRVDRPNVGIIYDTAHVAKSEGELMPAFEAAFDHLVLLQLADLPGRVEPGAGNLDLVAVAAAAVRQGYTGLVDLEHGWATVSKEGEATGLDRIARFDAMVRDAAAGDPVTAIAATAR